MSIYLSICITICLSIYLSTYGILSVCISVGEVAQFDFLSNHLADLPTEDAWPIYNTDVLKCYGKITTFTLSNLRK